MSIWRNLYKKLLALHVLKMPPLFPTLIQTNPLPPLPPIFFCILAFAWGSVEMNPGFYLLGFYRFSLSVTDRKQTTFLMLLHWYPLDKCLVFFVLTSILNQIHLPMLSRSGSITGLSDHWQIWFTPWINNQPIDTAIKTEIWTFLRIRLIHKNIYGPALMVTASGSQKRERDKGREREKKILTMVWKHECNWTRNGGLLGRARTRFSIIVHSTSSSWMITSFFKILMA